MLEEWLEVRETVESGLVKLLLVDDLCEGRSTAGGQLPIGVERVGLRLKLACTL